MEINLFSIFGFRYNVKITGNVTVFIIIIIIISQCCFLLLL